MESQSRQLVMRELADYDPSRRLKLLLDARKLGDGGIGVYIDNTVAALLELGKIEISVIASNHRQRELVRWSGEVRWIFDSAKPYSFSEYLLMPRRIDFSGYDIFHAPHFTLPFGVPIRTVVTLHDLIHIEHPESFYYPAVARRLITSAVRRADKVIAVSRDTRERVLKLTGVANDRIEVIPNSIKVALLANNDRPEITELPRLPKAYILAVLSNAKPHKGVDDLIAAWRGIPSGSCELVIAGFGSKGILERRTLSSAELLDLKISILGGVSDSAMRALYRGAQALVVPSLAEGFCLPALEAQSLGTRVICRPVGALLELVSNQDIVASDMSVAALGEAIKQAIGLSESVSAGGAEVNRGYLERFSGPVVARQLFELYSKLLGMYYLGT